MVINVVIDNVDCMIIIDYMVIVIDIGVNVVGVNCNNCVCWEWDGVFFQVNVLNILIVELVILIFKMVNLMIGDEGDIVIFIVVFLVSGGIVFDVIVIDVIFDFNLVFIFGSVMVVGGIVIIGNGGGDLMIQVDYVLFVFGVNVNIIY